MKLDSKLQILVDNYREEIDNLNFSFLANEDNYRITIQEKQKIIKYCQNVTVPELYTIIGVSVSM